MPKINPATKQKILDAAEAVFHENGFKGARTTQIAERSGVSRTMMHYYFRTKEDLFFEVLQSSFGFFLQHATNLFEGQPDLRTLINKLIDLISEMLSQKPGLPSFMVNILNEKPELITQLPIIENENLPDRFDVLLDQARQENQIQSNISGENLILNIYGMIAIPYLVKPLIRFKESRSVAEMNTFLEQRKVQLKSFTWNALLNN
ncbi:MAG: TetR/AcrR family transcriptional regulator [Bacteroidota bacterium]